MGKAYGIRTDWEWDWLGDYGTAVRDQKPCLCAAIASQSQSSTTRKHFDELVRTFGEAALVLLNAERIALFLAARCRWYSHRTMETIVKTADGSTTLSSKNTEKKP